MPFCNARGTPSIVTKLHPTARRWLEELTGAWLDSGLPLGCLISGHLAVLCSWYGRDDGALLSPVWAPRDGGYWPDLFL